MSCGKYTRKPIQERFWEKVRKTETCWLWTAGTTHYGYGVIRESKDDGGRLLRANRLSYEMHYGPIANDIEVLHRCDTPACVNPEHLFLGTQTDNMKDMAKKKRNRRGEKHHNSRLTEQDIRAIRSLRAQGLPYAAIAPQFGVESHAIGRICIGRTWSHVV